MKKILIIAVLVFSLGVGGCAHMSEIEQRTLSGGAIGAGAGAVVGAFSGHTLWGAAIGAAAGSAGGYLYGKHKEAKEEAYQKGYAAGQKSTE